MTQRSHIYIYMTLCIMSLHKQTSASLKHLEKVCFCKMQNKKLVRTPRGPSYSLPGILLRRWSPEAYVGELVHL